MKKYYRCDCCGEAVDRVFRIPSARVGILEKLFGAFESRDVCDRCYVLMCNWVRRRINEKIS